MGLFRRAAPSRSTHASSLGPGVVEQMHVFGRCEFYAYGNSVFRPGEGRYDGNIWSDITAPLYEQYQADPDRFIADLADLVVPVGSWAVLGGERMVVEVAGSDTGHPGYHRMLDGALDFLRAQGCPPKRITRNEWDHWCSTRGRSEDWLPSQPPPAEADVVLPPLAVGEERLLCRLWEGDDANTVLVERRADDRFVAVVEADRGDGSGRRVRNDLEERATQYALYCAVGARQGEPTPWYVGELAPFFTAPACTL